MTTLSTILILTEKKNCLFVQVGGINCTFLLWCYGHFFYISVHIYLLQKRKTEKMEKHFYFDVLLVFFVFLHKYRLGTKNMFHGWFVVIFNFLCNFWTNCLFCVFGSRERWYVVTHLNRLIDFFFIFFGKMNFLSCI